MWKNNVLMEQAGFHWVDDIFTKGDVNGNEYVAVNKANGGTDFHSRSQVPGTHSFFDTKAIYHHLEDIFADLNVNCIVDVGCGDGRTVKWFLENTNANIIAVDCSFESLNRLRHNYLESNKDYQDRVLLIHSNILNMPLDDGVCDFVWAFEVYCYLRDDFELGVQESLRLLINGGHFASAERSKAFGLLHELLNRGPEGMFQAHKKSEIIDHWNENVIYTKVMDTEQLKQLFLKHRLNIVSTYGIPFYSLITAFLKGQGIYTSEIESHSEQLSDLFLKYSSSNDLHRSTIFLTKKV